MNTRIAAAVAAALVLAAGCVNGGEPEQDAGSAPEAVEQETDDSRTERGPVSLASSEARHVSETELAVDVPSCNGNPELDILEENDQQVRVQVITTVSDPSRACLDGITIPLEAPLDGRNVIDIVSGGTLPVIQPQSGTEPGPVTPTDELWGRTYESVTTDEQMVEGTRIRLTFTRGAPVQHVEGDLDINADADGFATWHAGCNESNQQVSITDDRLTFDGYGHVTYKLCPTEEQTEQDQWVNDFFAAGPTWQLNDSRLELSADGLTIGFEAVD